MIGMEVKVAAYCRVSTDHADQINSLTSQKRYFYHYIQSKPEWKLVQIYYDEGVSGTSTTKRKGFLKMMKDALNGKIDLILSKDISRFARNTVDTLAYVRKLKEAGVRVLFINDHLDSAEESSEFLLSMKASLAQEESRKTSERVKWGQQRQMEAGVVFGRDLIGYKVKDGKLFVNEKEVPIVCAVFHKYTNEGKGTYTIAKELLAEGYVPKRGMKWNPNVILRMLRNEKYVGDLKQHKTYTPSFLDHKKKYNHGQIEFVEIKDHHEGIISRDLWNRTQEELKKRSLTKEEKGKYSNRYWCSGKIVCGSCGEHYISKLRKRKDGSQYKTWRCYKNAMEGGKKEGEQTGCSNPSIHEVTLMDCMRFSMRYLKIDEEDLKQEILREIQKIKDNTAEQDNLKNIQRKKKKWEEKKEKCIDLLLEGLISKKDFERQRQWYEQEIQMCHQMEENVKERKESWRDCMEDCVGVIDKILHFEEDSEYIYTQILEKIVVYPEKVLHIFLKDVPFLIKLKVKTKGRKDSYVTEIVLVDRVPMKMVN